MKGESERYFSWCDLITVQQVFIALISVTNSGKNFVDRFMKMV